MPVYKIKYTGPCSRDKKDDIRGTQKVYANCMNCLALKMFEENFSAEKLDPKAFDDSDCRDLICDMSCSEPDLPFTGYGYPHEEV